MNMFSGYLCLKSGQKEIKMISQVIINPHVAENVKRDQIIVRLVLQFQKYR